MSGADSGPVGRREVAYRLFAAEYDDADLEYSDSDEERAPNYVVTPTGARVNRLFAVGVLTEVEPVSDDVLRARVVDPTGAFVAYAGQYQPEAVAFLEAADVPSFVSLTGKARTFQPDGSDRVFTSVRPESITAVDAETRDRWTVQAAEHTLARIATMARALDREERGEALTASLVEAGVVPGLASGIALAIDHYGTTRAYLAALREQAIAATQVVTGDREAVPDRSVSPDDEGDVEADLGAAPAVTGTLAAAAELGAPTAEPGPAPSSSVADSEPEPTAEPTTEPGSPTEPGPADGPATPEEAGQSDDEVDAEPAAEAPVSRDGPDADELGDFEDHEAAEEPAPTAEPYELDEAEREAVEAEFGTEFSTGSEVGEPGEAGIEPEAEQPAEAAETDAAEPDGTSEPSVDIDAEAATDPTPEAAEETEAEPDAAPEAAEETTAEPDVAPETAEETTAEPDVAPDAADETEAEPAEAPADVDLEDAAVEAMDALDDGDGVDRDAVVEAVVEAHGVDEGAVEDAIQAALMGGRCYEPTDGTLKAI